MEVRETNAKYFSNALRETEVGPIPLDWSIVSLDEITDSERPISYGIVQTGPRIQNGVPCLRVVDIQNGKILHGDLITTSEEISNAYRRTKLREGDLVAPLRGKVGECAQVAKSLAGANLTRGVALVAVLPKYSAAYCKQFFSSSRSRARLNGSMNGSALQEVPIATLRSFKIALPPTVDEQNAIAKALADADALIDSLEQLLTKKRQIKQGAMQELLTGKRRLPGFGSKWQSRPVQALANVQRGASPRPIDDPVWFDDSSRVGWVRISDVTQSGMYLQFTTQRLSEAGIRKSRFVSAGNLIMSICATVGRPIITALDTCIHDGFVVFDGLKVDQKFLYYALLSIEDGWSKHGQTGSQMNLNTGLINRTEIPVPDEPEEQAAIAQVLTDMDADITAFESRFTKARALKQAMAQALLTGRIRLVEPTA